MLERPTQFGSEVKSTGFVERLSGIDRRVGLAAVGLVIGIILLLSFLLFGGGDDGEADAAGGEDPIRTEEERIAESVAATIEAMPTPTPEPTPDLAATLQAKLRANHRANHRAVGSAWWWSVGGDLPPRVIADKPGGGAVRAVGIVCFVVRLTGGRLDRGGGSSRWPRRACPPGAGVGGADVGRRNDRGRVAGGPFHCCGAAASWLRPPLPLGLPAWGFWDIYRASA